MLLLAMLALASCGGGSDGSSVGQSTAGAVGVCGSGSAASGAPTTTTVAHGWSAAVKLSDLPPRVDYVGGAADNNGNVLLAWREPVSATSDSQYFYAARYDAATSVWRPAVRLATFKSDYVPALFAGRDGNAVVAWMDNTDLYAARYDSASDSWGKPVTVSAGGRVRYFYSAASANGNVVLTWQQEITLGSRTYHLYAASYASGDCGWSAPVQLDVDDGAGEGLPKADVNGNVFVRWIQGTATRVRRYSIGTRSWGAVAAFDGQPIYNSVATDTAGNAFLALAGARVARYDVITGTWGTPVQVDTNPGSSLRTYSAIIFPPDANGNAFTTFDVNGNGFTTFEVPSGCCAIDLYAARFNRTTGQWGASTRLDIATVGSSSPVRAPIVDVQGNAAIVWVKGADGVGGGPYVSRYSIASNQWTTINLNTGTGTFINGYVHSLAGSVLLLGWSQMSGTNTHAYVSRVDLPTTTAPQVITVDAPMGGSALVSDVKQDGGNGLVVWTQSNGTLSHLYSMRYDAAARTWSAPTVLEATGALAPVPDRLAQDNAGNSYLDWLQGNASDSKRGLAATRYDAATGAWESATILDGGKPQAFGSSINVVDSFPLFPASSGEIITWLQGSTGDLFASVYR
jgi:hypothetical protein